MGMKGSPPGRPPRRTARGLRVLLDDVRGCRICADALPHEPRPVIRVGWKARIVMIGQAPGGRVHETGIPWNDPSGEHLRSWLDVDEATFEDPNALATMPMGFCFPGRRKGGDAPPRPECAPAWHDRLLAALPPDPLLLLVGQYAQARYLGRERKGSLTETVAAYREYLPSGRFPLPHPSWRSKLWMERHPWFAADVLPALRAAVHARLGG